MPGYKSCINKKSEMNVRFNREELIERQMSGEAEERREGALGMC